MPSDMRGRVRQAVREARNVLSSTHDANQQQTALSDIAALLPETESDTKSRTRSSIFSHEDLCEARPVFISEHYTRFLDFLLGMWSVDWAGRLPRGLAPKLFDVFFLRGDSTESLIILCRRVASSKGLEQNKCASLLEVWLRRHRMDECLWDACLPSSEDGEEKEGAFHREQQDEMVTLIATLPERISNRFQRQTSDIFYPDVYVPLVCKSLLTALQRVRHRITSNDHCSLVCLGALLGKLCITGYGDTVWLYFLPNFNQLMRDDLLWGRVLSSLIAAIPARCLETVIVPLVRHASWHGVLTKLLGLTVLTSPKLQFILTTKLLLMRFFTQDVVLQNIIGYLAAARSTVPLFVETFQKLFEVWSEASTLRHTSYEQHLYITKALLVCVAFLEPSDRDRIKDGLIQQLMTGIKCHLDSSLVKVQRLGMIVGEVITSLAHTDGEPLVFQYEQDEETKNLHQLLVRPTEPDLDSIDRRLACSSLADESEDKMAATEVKDEVNPETEATSDLDSDDDLVPYDMSHDVKTRKVKSPMYIRDCMEGLLNSDEVDQVEACLFAAEKLIRQHPASATEIVKQVGSYTHSDGLRPRVNASAIITKLKLLPLLKTHAVAAEFTKILLHLQNAGSIDSFMVLRQNVMVALTAISPIPVATYLTAEFYERNYNLRQRIDILEVLGSAARELSKPSSPQPIDPEGTTEESIITGRGSGTGESITEPGGWREVVDRRVASHTRRFATGGRPKTPETAPNRFAPVAGHFFFPLLRNFDRKENCLDMVGEDHMMLRRLVCTLGVVMHEAIHAPIARQMATSLLQFVWVLRYHPEASVRQSLLFAVSMTILAVPAHFLVTDLQTEVMETKSWLEDVMERDVDFDCKKMAVQTLALLGHSVKKEFDQKAVDTG